MPNIPGTMRGPRIPPHVEWDPEKPQRIYNCTDEVFHRPDCNKQCGSYPATEGLTALLNERRAWARVGINESVEVDGMSVQIRLEMVEKRLRAAEGMTDEEWDEEYRMLRADRMREMREVHEPMIRKAREQAQRQALKAPPGIINPHGEKLN